MSTPLCTSDQTRYVAIFDENSDIVIDDSSTSCPELARGYSTIDLNSDWNALSMTLEQWKQLGELPAGYSLLETENHPILSLVFSDALDQVNAESFIRRNFPQGYPYFSAQDLDDTSPSNIVDLLLYVRSQLEEEVDLNAERDDDEDFE